MPALCTHLYDYAAAETVPVTACNLCGAPPPFQPVADVDRYGFPVRTVQCDQCGLRFQDPQLSAAAARAFYETAYRPLVSAYHGRLINAETIQAEQAAYATQVVDGLYPWLTDWHAAVLDVGGSTGVVAEAVCHMGAAHGRRMTATVLDPCAEELSHAAARGMETLPGGLEQYTWTGHPYDLVLLCQTVDHLLDISGALAKIRALLPAHGLLYVDILDTTDGPYKLDHPYALVPRTMLAYLTRAGFNVLSRRLTEDRHVAYVVVPGRHPRPRAL
jgi:2-polyprenyl-3-methyl-5-hydroxy-6-metoxy-1,4-benzoquinol methylase